MFPEQYFIQRGAKVVGPYSLQQLRDATKQKKLRASDQISTSQDGPWFKYGDVYQDVLTGKSPLVMSGPDQLEVLEDDSANDGLLSLEDLESSAILTNDLSTGGTSSVTEPMPMSETNQQALLGQWSNQGGTPTASQNTVTKPTAKNSLLIIGAVGGVVGVGVLLLVCAGGIVLLWQPWSGSDRSSEIGDVVAAVEDEMAIAERRAESSSKLKAIAVALHTFHDTHKGFPAAYNMNHDGTPLLSWRVHLLPYVGEVTLYDEFHFDEPWDSEHNKKLVSQMPEIYRSPDSQAGAGKTNYLGVGGDRGVLVPPAQGNTSQSPRGIRMAEIVDGTSNTIVVVETNDANAVIWTKPEDINADEEDPLQLLKRLQDDQFLAAFCNGEARPITVTTDPKLIRAQFTRDGGESIQADVSGVPAVAAVAETDAGTIDATRVDLSGVYEFGDKNLAGLAAATLEAEWISKGARTGVSEAERDVEFLDQFASESGWLKASVKVTDIKIVGNSTLVTCEIAKIEETLPKLSPSGRQLTSKFLANKKFLVMLSKAKFGSDSQLKEAFREKLQDTPWGELKKAP